MKTGTTALPRHYDFARDLALSYPVPCPGSASGLMLLFCFDVLQPDCSQWQHRGGIAYI